MGANRELDRAGWFGSVNDFLRNDIQSWEEALRDFHIVRFHEVASPQQVTAWRNSHRVLSWVFSELVEQRPEVRDATVVFEYMLPREGGRRADAILLYGDRVHVIEFKDFAAPLRAHVDQVAAYKRDLENYHAGSHGRAVLGYLVPTLARELFDVENDVTVVDPVSLADVLFNNSLAASNNPINPTAWIAADYEPLPSLVEAARSIFENEPLPQIRRASSAGIPETVAELLTIAQDAEQTGTRHLALVTGIPGSGKTLVGLQFVHSVVTKNSGTGPGAVFLSGNGPLVSVLQHALKSRVFVQDVHKFLEQYGGETYRVPREHIWVYDEAQRAWDVDQVRKKRPQGRSEPEEFLRLGQHVGSWAMLVGLIGEGQEIHLGEEAGLGQWDEAIQQVGGDWIVHCAPRLETVFTHANRVQLNERLDLTQSLRTHVAEDVQRWVASTLSDDLASAHDLSESFTKQGFDAYITRDLERAKAYVRDRYGSQPDKRYGLIASNKAKNLEPYGVRVDWAWARNLKNRIGNWYNDPQDSPRSCCQFRDTAREFECQGLELDMPIVCWGDDFFWGQSGWRSVPQPRSKARDPHQLRVNSYRVLLSRGRDGMIVFVPPTREMDATANALLNAGLIPLE